MTWNFVLKVELFKYNSSFSDELLWGFGIPPDKGLFKRGSKPPQNFHIFLEK